MSDVAISIIAVGISGAILTIARRWKNEDSDAGYAVSGWTLVMMFLLVLFGIFR